MESARCQDNNDDDNDDDSDDDVDDDLDDHRDDNDNDVDDDDDDDEEHKCWFSLVIFRLGKLQGCDISLLLFF